MTASRLIFLLPYTFYCMQFRWHVFTISSLKAITVKSIFLETNSLTTRSWRIASWKSLHLWIEEIITFQLKSIVTSFLVFSLVYSTEFQINHMRYSRKVLAFAEKNELVMWQTTTKCRVLRDLKCMWDGIIKLSLMGSRL